MSRHWTVLSAYLIEIASVIGFSQNTDGWKTCRNDRYGVSFRYPAQWHHSDEYGEIEFDGQDGSVQVTASKGTALRPLCNGAATHKLKPYGKHPQVQFLKVLDRPACIVWPSADQGEPYFAELIVKYPQPLMIDGDSWTYLIINADKDHLRPIMRTLQFIQAPGK